MLKHTQNPDITGFKRIYSQQYLPFCCWPCCQISTKDLRWYVLLNSLHKYNHYGWWQKDHKTGKFQRQCLLCKLMIMAYKNCRKAGRCQELCQMRVVKPIAAVVHPAVLPRQQICVPSRFVGGWKDPSERCEEGSTCTAMSCYSCVWDNSCFSVLDHPNEVLNAWLLGKRGHPLPYPSSNSKCQALELQCCRLLDITGSS